MDNNTKMKALMIYFDHWGIEEAKQRRQQEGYELTMNKINTCFFGKNNLVSKRDLLQEVAELEDWNNPRGGSYSDKLYFKYFWHKLIDLLLSGLGGDIDSGLKSPFEYRDARYHHVSFARRMNINLYTMYKIGLDDPKDMLSIDAIVGLPPLPQRKEEMMIANAF